MTPKLELDTADEQDFTTRDFLLLASVNMLHHQINSDCDRCRYFVNIFEQSLKNKALSKEKPSSKELEAICDILTIEQRRNIYGHHRGKTGCVAFLSKHRTNFSMYFSQYMKPFLVCPYLGCHDQPLSEMEAFLTAGNISGNVDWPILCSLCKKYAKSIVQDILIYASDPARLGKILNYLCSSVPSPFKSTCKRGVQTLLNHIPEIVKAGSTAGAWIVCKLIKACF